MDDRQAGDVLKRLGSRQASNAWAEFLREYSPIILQVVQLFERDPDHVSGCFLFVCERLHEKGFRRLRAFQPGGPAAFTSAGFSGSATVCINYGAASYGTESNLRLLHYENGQWVNRTSSIDTANNIICATVESFSPFVVAEAVDVSPPEITPAIQPAPNAARWNRADVTVTWSITDPESGIAWSTGCSSLSVTNETSAAGVTFACETVNGVGLTASRSVTIKLDKTSPQVVPSASPAANHAGWNNSDVSVSWSVSDDLSGIASASGCSSATLTQETSGTPLVCQVSDRAGNTASVTTLVRIDNTVPTVLDIALSQNPIPTNTPVALSATGSDAGSGLATLAYNLDGGSYSDMASGASVYSAALQGSATAAVQKICVKAADRAGNESAPECLLLASYDPSAGFVTGGGWIISPAGSYSPNPNLSGKATFGFVSKYLPGATVPSGDTQFQFRVADLNFKSTSYEWLVISGARAQFKGTGTINGAGSYSFLLTAVDGQVPGGNGTDRFRLKIWTSGGAVYDNQLGADNNADPST
ncbi:MAG: hypothetical protein ACREUU_08000, partial [Gammaproteobacteria bacterium]